MQSIKNKKLFADCLNHIAEKLYIPGVWTGFGQRDEFDVFSFSRWSHLTHLKQRSGFFHMCMRRHCKMTFRAN